MSEISSFLTGESSGILPFENPLTAAKLFFAACALLIIYAIVRAAVFSKALTLHRAPATVAFAYVAASVANIIIAVLFRWFAALPLCIIMTVIFLFSTASEVKDANTEERMGIWGLNRDIRRIRGELFNDMSPEEQVAFRSTVTEYRFNKPLFVAVTLAVPTVFVILCHFVGLGYELTLPF